MPSSQAIDGLASGLNTTEIINAIMEFDSLAGTIF